MPAASWWMKLLPERCFPIYAVGKPACRGVNNNSTVWRTCTISVITHITCNGSCQVVQYLCYTGGNTACGNFFCPELIGARCRVVKYILLLWKVSRHLYWIGSWRSWRCSNCNNTTVGVLQLVGWTTEILPGAVHFCHCRVAGRSQQKTCCKCKNRFKYCFHNRGFKFEIILVFVLYLLKRTGLFFVMKYQFVLICRDQHLCWSASQDLSSRKNSRRSVVKNITEPGRCQVINLCNIFPVAEAGSVLDFFSHSLSVSFCQWVCKHLQLVFVLLRYIFQQRCVFFTMSAGTAPTKQYGEFLFCPVRFAATALFRLLLTRLQQGMSFLFPIFPILPNLL